MELVSKGCAAHGHREFVVEVGALPGGETLIGWLEQAVAAGTKFLPGQTLQFGWIWLQVREAGERLTLYEPDMKAVPIEWVPGVVATLRGVLRQKYVAESFGLQMAPAIFNHSAVVCSRYGSADSWQIDRAAPHDNDSGWVIACRDESHVHEGDEIRWVSIYEVAVNAPPLLEYLALPPGTVAIVDALTLYVLQHDGKEIEAQPGSYIDAKTRGLDA